MEHHWKLFVVLILVHSIRCIEEDLLDQYVKHVEARNSIDYDQIPSNINHRLHHRKPRSLNDKLKTKRHIFHSDLTQWTHSAALDENNHVILRWQPRHQEILFRVEARTRGYVGIGFSPDGGMENADMVIGWVDDRNSRPYILDCHGVPKSQGSAPVRDEVDNYTLMRGIQNDTHTVIEFRRVLDTCDPNDYVLNSDTVRIIWALHDVDPPERDGFIYHGENRGVQSLHLLAPSPLQTMPTGNTRHWDVTLKNFKVNDNMNTIYWCKVFKAPTLNSKHHITGFEPTIGKNHTKMVHHMIMHECQLEQGANMKMWDKFANEDGQLCYNDMPIEWEKCLTPLVAWAVGSKGEFFPKHVGLPLASRPNSYYMLEVHFDNPSMKQAVDTSGLRLHYTSELRENDGGILITGVAPSTLHFIPPYQEEYKTAGYCSFGCTKEIFPKNGINVVSVMLHSHLAGRKLKLRHIRGGRELPPLAQDEHYDFNYQQSRTLSQDTTILPGDGLITECTYSTLGRSRPTLGGYSTSEEMCLAFVLHYPRTELAGCYSIPPVKYFFENLGVKEFYGKNMEEIEKTLLEGESEIMEKPQSTTSKPLFQYKPGDELNPEANRKAILALQMAKEFSIEGETTDSISVFDKLIIKEPMEFRNKSFSNHLLNIPYNETILTKKIEEYFYTGLHLTFCRKRDDTLAIKENIEKLPTFSVYEDENSIQCSYKQKRSSSSTTRLHTNLVILSLTLAIFCI
ncbi:unnamed protein product [Brassicogethes aeneus]|uniref:DOMON domain-containing protein n=1 Tax=Brassicogethes aeneus TaxID=1431903 RepID=A0A9P0BF64_BRAAE|nr:unnamed protein product [Brassicogethes aeneus]